MSAVLPQILPQDDFIIRFLIDHHVFDQTPQAIDWLRLHETPLLWAIALTMVVGSTEGVGFMKDVGRITWMAAIWTIFGFGLHFDVW